MLLQQRRASCPGMVRKRSLQSDRIPLLLLRPIFLGLNARPINHHQHFVRTQGGLQQNAKGQLMPVSLLIYSRL